MYFYYSYLLSQLLLRYYEFIDHYNFDREVVSVAISYFDRFMAISADSFDAEHAMDMYQKVAVTALFLACKLYATTSCEVENVLEARSRALSKLLYGTVDPQDLLKMELDMLRAFEWHVNPPTMHQFAFLFFKLHPLRDTCPLSGSYLYEATRYQVELAVFVPELLARFKPSVVVCAAMNNALEKICADNPYVISTEMKQSFETMCAQQQINPLAVAQCQLVLKRLYPQLPTLDYFFDDAMVATPGNSTMQMVRNVSNSPTNVADF